MHQRLFVHKHFAYKPVIGVAPHAAKIAQPAAARADDLDMGEERLRFVWKGVARGRAVIAEDWM
jgi:hypothetical protein